MKFKAIKAKLDEIEDVQETFDGEGWNEKKMEALFGPSKVVGRGGGEGEEYWVVRHFSEHDVYVRLPGYYSSYDGIDYEEFEQVYPHQVTMTVFSKSKTNPKK
jgi:hypothetical protein